MSMNIPRPEYPRPQFVREKWINLNGEWEFEIDNGKSGRARKLYENTELGGKILVPFCPESELSGVGNKDFMYAVWYKKEFNLPDDWNGSLVYLHFGAVDYYTEVWINGQSAGTHKGGYSSFHFDITKLVKPGSNTIALCAEDDTRSGLQPSGKQSDKYHSYACMYTRTTGIWQTVWLESVPETNISSFRITPDSDNSCVHISYVIKGVSSNCRLTARATFNGKTVGSDTIVVNSHSINQTLRLSEAHLWQPGNPALYDLELTLEKENKIADSVSSYFGLRSVTWDNNVMKLNGKPLFQRLVLDQGFYPDGIYTAPSDDALKNDIEISMGLGFNGARMHEKIFEPRFIYWADRLGYLVWGEHANWGLDITTSEGLEAFLPEWIEALERDFNHPAIIGWCPFNETWDLDGTKQDNNVLDVVYRATKSIDPTRPVIDTSGNFHVITDIFDIHDYEQDVGAFEAKFEGMKSGGEAYNNFPNRQTYQGQPYFVSEYGGIWWDPNASMENGWGYGNRPDSEAAFLKRYEGLTTALLTNPRICAFCYTQLYDVEQEVNGLYTYDRKPKFDPEIIRKINLQKAAIEE